MIIKPPQVLETLSVEEELVLAGCAWLLLASLLLELFLFPLFFLFLLLASLFDAVEMVGNAEEHECRDGREHKNDDEVQFKEHHRKTAPVDVPDRLGVTLAAELEFSEPLHA